MIESGTMGNKEKIKMLCFYNLTLLKTGFYNSSLNQQEDKGIISKLRKKQEDRKASYSVYLGNVR